MTWTASLAALALVIAAGELLVMRRAWTGAGVFAWEALADEWPRVAQLAFGATGFTVILLAQLAAAGGLAATDHPAPAWLAFATTLATAVRFRGTYNGGSDAMLLIVTTALAVARTWPALERAALTYLAAQLVLSYVLAGVAKLGDPAWRSGRALPALVRLPQYAVPPALATLASQPALARAGAFAILAFELAAPLALVDHRAAIALVVVGGAFHLGNAVTFGLNRFLWAWLAAYPALLSIAGSGTVPPW